jgi:hypothetical protein
MGVKARAFLVNLPLQRASDPEIYGFEIAVLRSG